MADTKLRAAPWLLTVSWLLLVGGSGANITEPASLSVVSMHTGDQPLFTSLVVHTPGAEGSATVGSPDELQRVSQTQHWPYTASMSPTHVVGNTVEPPDSALQSSHYQQQPQQQQASLQQQLLENQRRRLQLQLKQVQQQLQQHQQEQLQQEQLHTSHQQPGSQALPAVSTTTTQQVQVTKLATPLPQLFHSHVPPESHSSTPPPISSLLLTRGNALFFLNDVGGSSSPRDQLQAPAEVGSAGAGRDAFDHAKALGNSDTFHQSDAMPATTPVATTPPPAPSLTSPPASPLQSMPYRQQLQKPHSWPPQPVASQQHRESQHLQLQSSNSGPRQPQASQSTEQQLQLQQLKKPHSSPRESPQPQTTGQQQQGQKLRVKQKHRSNRHRHNKQRPSSPDHTSVSSGTDFANGSGGAGVPPPPTLPPLGGRWDVSTQQLSTQQLPPQLGVHAGSFVAQLPLTPGGGPDAATVPALVIPITPLQAAASPSLLLQLQQQQQQLPWGQQLQPLAIAGQHALPLLSYFPQSNSGLHFPSTVAVAPFGNNLKSPEEERPLVTGSPQPPQERKQPKEQQRQHQRQQQQQRQYQQQQANYSQNTQRIQQIPPQEERLVTAAPQFASSPYLSSSSALQTRPPAAAAQAQTRTPQPYHQAAAQHATAEAPHPSVREPPAYPHHEYQDQQPALGPQHQSPVSAILTAPAHAAVYSPAVSSVTTAPVHPAHTYLQTVAAAALQQQPSVVPQTLHQQLYHDSPLHSGVVVFPEEARQQLYQQITTPVPPISRPNPHHHGPLHNGAILVSHVPRQHEHQQSQVYYNGGILLPEVLRKYLYPNQVHSIAPLNTNSPRDHYHQQNLVQHSANLGPIPLRQQPYHHIQVQGSATQLSDVPRPQPYQQGNVHHIATLGSDILRLQPHQQGPLNNGAATRQHPQQLSPVNSGVRSAVPNSAAASSGRVVVSVEPAIVKSLSYQQTAVVPEQKPSLQSSGTSSSVYQSTGGQHMQMITAVPSQSTILLPVASNVHHTSPHLATTYVRPLQTSNNVVHEPQHMMSDNGFRISHDKHAAMRGYTGASPVSVIYRSSIGVTSPNNRAPHQDGAGRPQRHNNDLQTALEVDLRPPPPIML
ncbi:uncharacterized protein LOC126292109 isoform X2 [Schistocerca gregaria]|uniref:uncharacterized protein LOC126292109 isoform X2 n=1 Tax=Schistocerca gregaria TaxID=7010 RepID=UPI00211F43BC|nr:uncharacterized protein LOC126292109 isoform X2 [Schistocerca gregaria]